MATESDPAPAHLQLDRAVDALRDMLVPLLGKADARIRAEEHRSHINVTATGVIWTDVPGGWDAEHRTLKGDDALRALVRSITGENPGTGEDPSPAAGGDGASADAETAFYRQKQQESSYTM